MDSLNNRARRTERLRIKRMADRLHHGNHSGNFHDTATHVGFLLMIFGFLTIAFATPVAQPAIRHPDLQYQANK